MKPLRSRTERLPEAELDLLAELRRAGEASAADLRRGIARRRPMAHGSVLTLLGRLEAKGLVTRRKGESGKAYLYTATARAEQAIRNLVTRWIDRLYARDRTAFVATLLEEAPPSADEIQSLKNVLESHEASKPKTSRGHS